MPWNNIWAIAVAFGLPGTVLTLGGRWLWRWLKRRLSFKPKRRDSKAQPHRPHRRPHRHPLFQPVFASAGYQGQALIGLVRQSGCVPLFGYPHPSRIRSAGRWIKRNFWTFDTDPKPAFAITGWDYRRQRDLGSSHFPEHSIGFILSFELEERESPSHFLHSLKSAKQCEQRLVAIAPVEALADPTAWVRCLVVNAYNTDISPDQKRRVAVQATRVTALPNGSVFRARQKDIPDDALWLICRAPAQTPPGPDWGQTSAHLTPASTHFPAPPDEHRQHITQARRRDHRWQLKVGLVFGLVLPVALLLLLTLLVAMVWWSHWWLSRSSDLELEWLVRLWHFLVSVPEPAAKFWAVVVCSVPILWLAKWSAHRMTRISWLKQDNPDANRKDSSEQVSPDAPSQWSAGTSESLLHGSLFLGGPGFDPGQWQQYWSPSPPSPHQPPPTPSSTTS